MRLLQLIIPICQGTDSSPCSPLSGLGLGASHPRRGARQILFPIHPVAAGDMQVVERVAGLMVSLCRGARWGSRPLEVGVGVSTRCHVLVRTVCMRSQRSQ